MLEKLKAQKRWFCWKLETRQGQDKHTKVPYSAISGRKTGTDAKFSDTWTDYESARKSCAEHGYSGVGFRIPEDMFFLDIDHTMMFSILVDHATVYPEKRIVFTFRDEREV